MNTALKESVLGDEGLQRVAGCQWRFDSISMDVDALQKFSTTAPATIKAIRASIPTTLEFLDGKHTRRQSGISSIRMHIADLQMD